MEMEHQRWPRLDRLAARFALACTRACMGKAPPALLEHLAAWASAKRHKLDCKQQLFQRHLKL